MIDLPYCELQAQQAEICRRQRLDRWIQDHPQGSALPHPQAIAPAPDRDAKCAEQEKETP